MQIEINENTIAPKGKYILLKHNTFIYAVFNYIYLQFDTFFYNSLDTLKERLDKHNFPNPHTQFELNRKITTLSLVTYICNEVNAKKETVKLYYIDKPIDTYNKFILKYPEILI